MNCKAWLLFALFAGGLAVDGEELERPDVVRREILLEKAPAAKVLASLTRDYPETEFVFHPILNGFFCIGSRKDSESIARAAAQLDVIPPVSPPTGRRLEPPSALTKSKIDEVKRFLSELKEEERPDSPPESADQKPEVRVSVDVRMVELSPPEHREICWLSSSPVYIFDVAQANSSQKFALPLGLFLACKNGPGLNLGSNELTSSRMQTLTNTRVSVELDDRLYKWDEYGETGPYDVGFGLSLKAEDRSDGYMDFEFISEFKSVSSWKGRHSPTLLRRRTICDARLRRGDSFFIGLPTRPADFDASRRVPELRELPRLGAFFRDRNTARKVFFVVTPLADR